MCTINSAGFRIVLWMGSCPSHSRTHCIWRWRDGAFGKYLGLDKVMRVKGEPHDWISGVMRREPGGNLLSPLCENTVRRQHLHVKRRAVI